MSVSTAGSSTTAATAAPPPAASTAVSYQGSFLRNSCGYCNEYGGFSFNLRAQSLTVRHYQCLVDRGWRRSGCLLYKPHMRLTCCKHYTIRASRDQRQCVHRWTKHVLGEDYIREAAVRYPKSKEEKKKARNQQFDLAVAVHAAEYSTIERRGHIPPAPAHRFQLTLEHASFSEEKFDLYRNYQSTVHSSTPENITARGFNSFLCNSPLETRTEPATGKRLGSWHQCYRLDGRLVAMAVLDLLPECVSGVYFIYHSDFARCNLGKVSACMEASLAMEGGYRYYYMGYYIPSCQKMRYKGEYGPSELLDPATNRWMPLDETLKKQLAEDPSAAIPSDPPGAGDDDGDDDDDDDDDYDEEEEMAPGYSIQSRMPGLMPPEELAAFDLSRVKVRLRRTGREYVAEELYHCIRETVAAVGPQVASEMVMVF